MIFRLRRFGIRRDIPFAVLHSEGDEIVSKRSLKRFEGMGNGRMAVLPGCGHFLYTTGGRDRVLDELMRMLPGKTMQA